MTRRSRERRAAAGDGDPAGPPHYEPDEERRLAEEVLYLHSLWRSGPPAPAGAPAQPAGGSRATRPARARPKQRKRRRIERPAAEPEGPGTDWPLAPSPPASPSPASWPDATPAPRPPPQQPSPASLAQRDALRAAEEFFSGRGASGEGSDDESEGSESEDGGDAAAEFFLGLFERDAALRGYYERSHEEGEFRCMGCVGRKGKGRRQARRFRDCKSLVHHARDATRCGRPLAHRALAAAVCRVLGWDVKRLPSIVIDPCGTLGQALLAREGASAAASTAHEAKDNGDAGENGHKDAAEEDVGLEKNGSLNDERKEDVDSIMNDGPLSDGDATKEDVDKGKIDPPSNNNDEEVHEQGNGTGTAEKEYDAVKAPAPAAARGTRTDRRKPSRIERPVEPEEGPDSLLAPSPPATTSPSSWPDATPASLAQQNGSLNDHKKADVDSIMNDAPLSDGNAAKDDVAAGKISPPSKDNGGEVDEQENDTRTVEKEGAIGNKQERPKSADDMGGTCDVRLENNSSKEEAATENKEEHNDGVVDSGDDIGNLGNNLMDSSKS